MNCARCGSKVDAKINFCPNCGAPVKHIVQQDEAAELGRQRMTKGRYGKVSFSLLCFLALLGVAIILVMIDGFDSREILSTAQPVAVFSTPTPSPGPTPTPPAWANMLGSWTASRVEVNKNKVKPYVEMSFSHELRMEFRDNGTVMVYLKLAGEERVYERTYSAEGDSLYVDYGDEEIDGERYFGRTRYFIKSGLMMSVYLLDGKESSDYMVFSRVEDTATHDGTLAESTPFPEG